MTEVGAPSSDAIRRRINREYMVVTAPSRLDGETAQQVLEAVFVAGNDCDLVLDLRDVERCDVGILDVFDRAAQQLARLGSTLTLSHPPVVVEAVLDDRDRDRAFDVRRPRQSRPVRRSLRGQF